MSTAPQGPTDQAITAALDAIAASLVRSVQQISDASEIDDAPSAELAAVGAFLLAYRRERAAIASTVSASLSGLPWRG